MSWWDASGLTSFATNVVKSAQKKIDRVLDIDEEPGDAAAPQSSASGKKGGNSEGDFWNTWLGSSGDRNKEKSAKSSKSPASKESSGKKSAASSWRSWGFEETGTEGDKHAAAQGISPRPGAIEPTRGTAKTKGLRLSTKAKREDEAGLAAKDKSTGVDKGVVSMGGKEPGPTGSGGLSQRLISNPEASKPDTDSQGDVKGTDTEVSQESPAVLREEDDSSGVPSTSGTKTEGKPQLEQHSAEVEKDGRVLCDVIGLERDVGGVYLQEPDAQSLFDRTGEAPEQTDTQGALDRIVEAAQTGGTLPEVIGAVDTSESVKLDVSESFDQESIPKRDLTEKVPQFETTEDATQNGLTEHVVQTETEEETHQTGFKDSVPHTEETEDLSQANEDLLSFDTPEQRLCGETGGLLPSATPDDKVDGVTVPEMGQNDLSEHKHSRGEGGRAKDFTDSNVQVKFVEDPSSTRGTECNRVVDSHLECIPETPGCEDTGDVDGLPVMTEAGGEPQVCQDESTAEAPPIMTQMTGMLLSVADQILDRSASTTSSMEIVSATELERSKDSKVSEERVGLDINTSDPTPPGGATVHEQHEGTIASVDTFVHQEGDNSLPTSPGGAAVHHEQSDSSLDTSASVDTVVHCEGDNSGDNLEEEEKETESASDGCSMTVSSSSSVVKTMLEEAMEDNLKHEECDSHSHSSSDKSDFVKSEFSDKSISGHESGDEIDTTTSSDIEIISTPTPNGDRQERLFDLSPLKIALSRANRRGSPKHRRSDSQSSSSTNSKPEQLSPGRDMEFAEDGGESLVDLSGHFHHGPTAEQGHAMGSSSLMSEEARNNPYDTEKLLKPSAGVTKEWAQKMAEMAEVINARENKLVQLSKENNDLLEANSILRNQLKQSEEAHELEMEDVNALTEEFTQRLGEAERKLQMALKEKESLKKQLEITQVEMVKKGDTSKFQKMLAEKDEQIQELLAEGEKLSKQQLQGNTIIKKLRSKEKETEQLVKSQKQKLEAQSSELQHLKLVLDSKEDMEKKQSDAISQLNNAVQRQEKEIARLKAELEDNQEKMRGMQTALDTSYKEIAELHRANAAKDSQAQEVAVSAEMQAREELRLTMERENQRYRQEKEGLIMQIEDLRISLSRMEKEHGRREDMLRQEISDLQQRLQEDEARNQELTQSVTSATRPLLRQIENLQSTYMAQSSSWETVEKNITERLGEAQTQLAMATEKERVSSEKVLELTAQVTTLEAQNARYRQEKSQLTAQNEMLKTKVEMLEDGKNNERAQIEAVRQGLNQEISELKREKILLENHLEMEKTKTENEKKKVALLQEQLKEKEKDRPRSRGTPSPAQMSRQESISSIPDPLSQLPAFTQEELLERSLMMTPHSPNGNKMTLYETLRQTGAANLLESLTSQLKQREGEITQLQSEIAGLERTRESMARELVNLSTQNDDLKDKIEGLPQLEAKHADLEQRYNALLQMYGEKVEETEELKLDLQDVKELYKSQIDHLMKGH